MPNIYRTIQSDDVGNTVGNLSCSTPQKLAGECVAKNYRGVMKVTRFGWRALRQQVPQERLAPGEE